MDEAAGAREPLADALATARRRVLALERDVRGVQAASRDTNADDEHDPEGATIAFERQQLVALLADARRTAHRLEAALERWDAGRHGLCESCGRAIAPARLAARPGAATCIDCARRG